MGVSVTRLSLMDNEYGSFYHKLVTSKSLLFCLDLILAIDISIAHPIHPS